MITQQKASIYINFVGIERHDNQQFKNKELVILLIQKNADRSLIDNKGKSAFEYAAFTGNEEIINLLK